MSLPAHLPQRWDPWPVGNVHTVKVRRCGRFAKSMFTTQMLSAVVARTAPRLMTQLGWMLPSGWSLFGTMCWTRQQGMAVRCSTCVATGAHAPPLVPARRLWLTIAHAPSPRGLCPLCSCGDGFHSASILCNAWAPRVGEFDLVVLNAGAHGPGHGVSHAVYERRLRAAASHVQAQARPGAVLLFRNTPFGHPGCDERRYLPPLPSVEAAEAYLSTGNAKGGRTYDWREFKQRNSVAAPIFEAAGFKVLDVYTPTSMRADAHIPKDCLHYCIPGPTLHWVNLAAAAVLDSGHGFGGGSRFTAHS